MAGSARARGEDRVVTQAIAGGSLDAGVDSALYWLRARCSTNTEWTSAKTRAWTEGWPMPTSMRIRPAPSLASKATNALRIYITEQFAEGGKIPGEHELADRLGVNRGA